MNTENNDKPFGVIGILGSLAGIFVLGYGVVCYICQEEWVESNIDSAMDKGRYKSQYVC